MSDSPSQTRMMAADQLAKRAAVRAACRDAMDKGKLSIAAMMYGVTEQSLREFAQGNDFALNESQIDWLAVDLRK